MENHHSTKILATRILQRNESLNKYDNISSAILTAMPAPKPTSGKMDTTEKEDKN